MELFYWDDIIKKQKVFPQGSAISIGGFDGPHRGHQRIFAAVLEAARRYGIPAGLITFRRSPRFLKAQQTYSGDVSTLEMRLRKFADCGFAFTVLIDFSRDFAKIKGTVFFDILIKTICIKYLAVGSDFTCGYRHDTGVKDLYRLASQKNFCFDSIEQLCSAQHDRISSSAIRQAVTQADFTLAKELLGYPFCLDVSKIAQQSADTIYVIDKSAIEQIIPVNGLYSAKIYIKTGQVISAYVQIRESLLEISCGDVAEQLSAAEKCIQAIEFIRKE